MSLTAIDLIAIPTSTATAGGLSIAIKVVYEIIMNKYNKDKEQKQRDQQTIKSFDQLYRKSLQDNINDKKEYESSCNIFTKNVDETKTNLFYKNRHKSKRKLLSHNKLKFILEPKS